MGDQIISWLVEGLRYHSRVGIISWLTGALAAWLIALWLPLGGDRHRKLPELGIAVAMALTAGLTATILDFGGWKEIELRAIVFAFAAAMIGIATVRKRGAATR